MSDTKNILLSVSYDSVDSIVLSELKILKRRLEDDLRNRINGKIEYGVFDQDKDTDIEKIEDHIRSVSNVISWYTVP